MLENMEPNAQGSDQEQLLATFQGESCALAPAAREVLMRALTLQLNNQSTMRDHLIEMSKMLLVPDEQNRNLQKLLYSKITVTAAQSRMLSREVIAQARSLCQRHRLAYCDVGRRYRSAITRDVLRTYCITALADLPAARFEAALRMITEWDSYKLTRELREKAMGGVKHA